MVNLVAKLQIAWPEELKLWPGSFCCIPGKPFNPEFSTLTIRSLCLPVPLHYKANIYELQPSVERPWSYSYFSGIRVS